MTIKLINEKAWVRYFRDLLGLYIGLGKKSNLLYLGDCYNKVLLYAITIKNIAYNHLPGLESPRLSQAYSNFSTFLSLSTGRWSQ